MSWTNYDQWKQAEPFENKRYEEYWEYLGEHHECFACQETFHETELHRTNMGWCCFGCYDYLHTECAGRPDLPEIL